MVAKMLKFFATCNLMLRNVNAVVEEILANKLRPNCKLLERTFSRFTGSISMLRLPLSRHLRSGQFAERTIERSQAAER